MVKLIDLLCNPYFSVYAIATSLYLLYSTHINTIPTIINPCKSYSCIPRYNKDRCCMILYPTRVTLQTSLDAQTTKSSPTSRTWQVRKQQAQTNLILSYTYHTSHTTTMARKAIQTDQIVKLIVGAGQASPSPPVGPALGSKGVKSMDFCKVSLCHTSLPQIRKKKRKNRH
jgi:hypothetical protein